MARLQHSVLYGNIISIRPAGKNKVISLAEATFSKDQSKESDVFDIMTFERQSEVVAAIEEALAARRAETGNEKAALQNVKVDIFISVQKNKDTGFKEYQPQLSKLLSIGKTSFVTATAEEADEAEAPAEA